MVRGAVIGGWIVLAAIAVAPTFGVTVRSWSASSAEELGRGALEGTAVDAEGRVTLAPSLENLWGPGEGIVWDVEPDGAGGAFVALSSPGRVLRVAAEGESEIWYEAGDESLIAAIVPDGEGGVYIGLSPEGRILRLRSPDGVEEVADTGALFIWALDRADDGRLWIGTGLPGMLLRHDAEQGIRKLFDSADDPVRCVTALPRGSAIFGTGGRGRVIRIDQDRPSVLLDAEEAEIVDLAMGEAGNVFVLAARGSKQISAARAAAETAADSVRVVAKAPPADDGEGEEAEEKSGSAPSSKATAKRFKTPPGGALYRVRADGDTQRIWQSQREVPFALERTGTGSLLVATGDAGRVYAIDGRGRASVLTEIYSDQASAMALGPDGWVLVGGTTDARVQRIGTGVHQAGRYFSKAIDGGTTVDWGRVTWDADVPPGAGLRLLARSGNTDEPDETWSDWLPLDGDGRDGVDSGLASSRFAQVQVALSPSRKGAGPGLRRLELFYLPHNRRPVIEEVTVQPAGVVWSHSTTQPARPVGPLVATDPVVRRTVSELRPVSGAKPVRKSYEHGARTVSWKAADPDGDRLNFRLDIRRDGTNPWIPLAVELEREFFGWDARGLPDGLYRVRLTVDDARENPEGKEYRDEKISGAFWIDNTRPAVRDRRVRREGDRIQVEFLASDPGGNVAAVEVAVDAGQWQPLDPMDGVADSAEERYRVSIGPSDEETNETRTLKVRVTDASGNLGGDAWALDDE